jgi:hypothetical protein
MRKRIGSKLYDTETSEKLPMLVSASFTESEQEKGRCFCSSVIPLNLFDDKQARALLGEDVKRYEL